MEPGILIFRSFPIVSTLCQSFFHQIPPENCSSSIIIPYDTSAKHEITRESSSIALEFSLRYILSFCTEADRKITSSIRMPYVTSAKHEAAGNDKLFYHPFSLLNSPYFCLKAYIKSIITDLNGIIPLSETQAREERNTLLLRALISTLFHFFSEKTQRRIALPLPVRPMARQRKTKAYGGTGISSALVILP